MTKTADALKLIQECERDLRSGGGLGEERLYADSATCIVAPPFASVEERLEYEYQDALRHLRDSWAPLGTSPDAVFPSLDLADGQVARATTLAVFPKGPLIGYLVMRRTEQGRSVIHVGVLRRNDDEPPAGGSGEGDEARVGLTVGRWVM